MHTTHVPSIVGVGTMQTGLLEAGLKRGRRTYQDQPARVTWNGWSYLVGPGVERYAKPIERMDLQRLSGSVEVQALTYKTLYDLLRDVEARRVALMVGLPVEVMADEALAKATRDGIRSWAEGEHEITVDGITLAFTVTRVQVMAQPAGTFFAWGFDDQGRWARSAAELHALIAVCDIGFNTLDLFTVQGGRIQGRFTGGDSLGMRRAAELIIQSVRRDHGFSLSKHEADALLRERNPHYLTAGELVDLSAVVNQARVTNTSSILSFLEEKWGNGRQFGHVMFTGGGAEALRDDLLSHYPHGYVMPNAVMANATGLARAGARALHKYAPCVVGLDPGYGGFKAVLLCLE